MTKFYSTSNRAPEEENVINSVQTECMDLETKPSQQWKYDEDSIKDTGLLIEWCGFEP